MSEEAASVLEPLTFEQARVLGCLIEKEMTTPEYYPLTLNSLVAACNQSSNRDPVVSFDEATVLAAIEGLKSRAFAFQVSIPGARVQKYKHNLNGKFPRLERPGLALMCVLLLRGIQTAGELRQRTERMQQFPDIPSLEAALQELTDHPDMPLAVRLPAGAGRKAVTYAHLLCGPVESAQPVVMASAARVPADPDWRLRVEMELESLRGELAELRRLIGAQEPAPEPEQEEPPSQGTFVP